jgi:branched-chain amino acid aminotransferase
MGARIVSIDGRVVTPAEAVVSVYDRGFLYGDAVFEVLRTYGGRPFALGEHLARLRRSAERVFIALPVDEPTLMAELDAALAAAAAAPDDSPPPAEHAGDSEWYVRLVVTRGSGPLSLDPQTATRPLRVILVEPVRPPPRDTYVRGIALATTAARRTVDGTAAAGAKVSNYLANLLALREAKSKGAEEALIIDDGGHVIEGASSNVFTVKEGKVATPPESAGILVGITREYVIDAARHLGVNVDERELVLADVYGADEVFITSSIREVLSVVRVDGRTIGSGQPGPMTRSLHRRFRQAVGVGDRPMPWEA